MLSRAKNVFSSMVDKMMWLVCGSPTMQRGAAWSM